MTFDCCELKTDWFTVSCPRVSLSLVVSLSVNIHSSVHHPGIFLHPPQGVNTPYFFMYTPDQFGLVTPRGGKSWTDAEAAPGISWIGLLAWSLLFLSASVSRIVFYVVIVFCAAIVRNKLLICIQQLISCFVLIFQASMYQGLVPREYKRLEKGPHRTCV